MTAPVQWLWDQGGPLLVALCMAPVLAALSGVAVLAVKAFKWYREWTVDDVTQYSADETWMTAPVDAARLVELAGRATQGPRHACSDEGLPTVAPGEDCSSQQSFLATFDHQGDADLCAAASPDAIRSLVEALQVQDAALRAIRDADMLGEPQRVVASAAIRKSSHLVALPRTQEEGK